VTTTGAILKIGIYCFIIEMSEFTVYWIVLSHLIYFDIYEV